MNILILNRKQLFVLALIILSLSALAFVPGLLSSAASQEDGERWNTSAEAPPGTPRERLSPPDNSLVNTQQNDVLAPEGLTSWRVIGAALKPRENDVSYSVNSSGGCTYVTAGDDSTVWNVPVDLPQGSEVDTLRMYYYDTSGSNMQAWFTVYDLYGNIVEEFSVSSSGDAGNSFNDSDPINHTIDYSTYAYLLNWRPVGSGSGLQLCGFRLFYNPPFFGLGFLPFYGNNP